MFKHFSSVLKSRNASLMLLASLTSTFGDWAYFVAISVHLVNNGGTALLGAIATIRFGCVFALGPLGGAIVERLPKKAVMITADFVRLALMLSLGAVMALKPDSLISIAGLSIASSLVGLLFSPARRALLPQTVEEPNRLALNAIDGSIGTVTLTLAPALAGLLLTWINPASVVAANGLSFLLSATFLFALSSKQISTNTLKSDDPRSSLLNDMKDGIRQIVHGREILAMTILGFVSHIAVGATWIFVPLISLELGLAASGTGYLSSAIGAGSIVGMLLGGSIRRKFEVQVAFTAVLLFTLSVVAWAFFHVTAAGAFVTAAVMGLTANVFEAPCWSILQSRTKQAMYARVFSGFDAITLAGMALGTQAAALTVEILSLRNSILLVAALMMAAYVLNFLIFSARARVDVK